MSNIYLGPTYEEMLNPRVENSGKKLFDISWKNSSGEINKIVLPKELTGIDTNIIVLLGKNFPSGSHKVGSAYSIIAEKIIDKEIDPNQNTVIAPSSGNFGIGVAYISKLLNMKSIVVMSKSMSKERYELINEYNASVDLIDSTSTNVEELLNRANELAKDSNNVVLNQFVLFSNYRFHRYVTGNTCIEAAKDVGNGKIAAFVSAPGSGGTLAAGDQIKSVYKNSKVVVVEPKECATLYDGSDGNHPIEGIGDKICTLIHNINNTDYITLVDGKACLKGLEIIEDGNYEMLKGLFGVSSLANIIASIKMAKYLKLGKDDNIVTIATDGVDRYLSVLDLFKKLEQVDINKWKSEVFDNITIEDIKNTQSVGEKERLYSFKEKCWIKFGFSKEYLNQMKDNSFWDNEYSKVKDYDKKIEELRK